jgi:hypothetical protein
LGRLEWVGDFLTGWTGFFRINGIFGLRCKVERGALGGRGRSGVCLRFASPFGQPVAGYLPSVGSRSDGGYFLGALGGFGVKAGLDLGAGADMSRGPYLVASCEVVEP